MDTRNSRVSGDEEAIFEASPRNSRVITSPITVMRVLTDEEADLRNGAVDEYYEQPDMTFQLRPPTAGPATTNRTSLQVFLTFMRMWLASITAINRDPVWDQPYRTMIDGAIVGPSFESGIMLWYLAGSDKNDLIDRVRNEGRGSILRGLGVGTLKAGVSAIAPTVIGFGVGSALKYFEEGINQRPWLRVLCTPPVARFILGPVGLASYLATKYVANRIYRPNVTHFNQRPKLHFLQTIMLYGARAYDAIAANEVAYMVILAYAPELALFWVTHSSVALFDQLLTNNDYHMAGGSSMYDKKPCPVISSDNRQRVTIVEDDLEQQLVQAEDRKDKEEEEEGQALLEDNDFHEEQMQDGVDRFSDSIAAVSRQRAQIRCDTAKYAAWYASRTLVVLIAAEAVNAAATQLGHFHPEEYDDSIRLLYYGGIVATGIAAERLMEDVIPWFVSTGASWIASKVSSCWASIFSRSDNEERPVNTEDQSLLREENGDLVPNF